MARASKLKKSFLRQMTCLGFKMISACTSYLLTQTPDMKGKTPHLVFIMVSVHSAKIVNTPIDPPIRVNNLLASHDQLIPGSFPQHRV